MLPTRGTVLPTVVQTSSHKSMSSSGIFNWTDGVRTSDNSDLSCKNTLCYRFQKVRKIPRQQATMRKASGEIISHHSYPIYSFSLKVLHPSRWAAEKAVDILLIPGRRRVKIRNPSHNTYILIFLNDRNLVKHFCLTGVSSSLPALEQFFFFLTQIWSDLQSNLRLLICFSFKIHWNVPWS